MLFALAEASACRGASGEEPLVERPANLIQVATQRCRGLRWVQKTFMLSLPGERSGSAGRGIEMCEERQTLLELTGQAYELALRSALGQ